MMNYQEFRDDLIERIAYKKGKARIGEVTKVFIDRYDYKMNMYRARDYSFAPDDVDGIVVFTSDKYLELGTFVHVNILDADEYDLYGELA